ncbi:MAG: hypothetical protein ACJAS3_002697 [Roseivirga sp.]|jgi:hypothetical protein
MHVNNKIFINGLRWQQLNEKIDDESSPLIERVE